MALGKFKKTTAIFFGLLLALFGVNLLNIAVIGKFTQGRFAAIAMGSTLLLFSLPLLAYPFSPRIARLLLVPLLFALALAFLWLSFHPAPSVKSPLIYQAAAIAFAVLLSARVGAALRRSSGPST